GLAGAPRGRDSLSRRLPERRRGGAGEEGRDQARRQGRRPRLAGPVRAAARGAPEASAEMISDAKDAKDAKKRTPPAPPSPLGVLGVLGVRIRDGEERRIRQRRPAELVGDRIH